jgi:hypothetical protein
MHAFIYSDGYCVIVRCSDNSSAGFPFLSADHPGKAAWTAAYNWAKARGATSIERRDPPGYLEGLLEFEKQLKVELGGEDHE